MNALRKVHQGYSWLSKKISDALTSSLFLMQDFQNWALRKRILVPKVMVGVCAYDRVIGSPMSYDHCVTNIKTSCNRLANIQSLWSSRFTLLQL